MFSKGAKTADLVPKQILTLPSLIFFHSWYLSLGDNLEWITDILLPKIFLNFFSIWGVRIISGTRTIEFLFDFKASSTSLIYISVFPEPVTPCSKYSLKLFLLKSFKIWLRTPCCFSFSCTLFDKILLSKLVSISSSNNLIELFSISFFTILSPIDNTSLTKDFLIFLFFRRID